jgi:hypothetical protein
MNVVLRAAVCALWCVVGVAQGDRAASRPYDAALAAAGVTVESAPALIVAAKAAFEAGDARLAAALLDVAATRTADSRPVKLDAARARLAAGEPAVALRACEALLADGATDVDAAVVRAQALVDLGESVRARDALSALQAAGALPPHAFDAWVALETEYGDPSRAETALRLAHAATPERLAPLRAAYLRSGRPDRALALADEVATRHGAPDWFSSPKDRDAFRDLARDAAEAARALGLKDREKGAWSAFYRSYDDDEPYLEHDWLQYLEEMQATGQTVKAGAAAHAGLQMFPYSAPIRIAAAQVEARKGGAIAAARVLLLGLEVCRDPDLLRAALDRNLGVEPSVSHLETAFSLTPAGLRFLDETLPLGAPGSSVRLRQLRVAAGSPRAALTIAAGHLSAEDLRRALDALAGAGFSRVRFP